VLRCVPERREAWSASHLYADEEPTWGKQVTGA